MQPIIERAKSFLHLSIKGIKLNLRRGSKDLKRHFLGKVYAQIFEVRTNFGEMD